VTESAKTDLITHDRKFESKMEENLAVHYFFTGGSGSYYIVVKRVKMWYT